MAHAEHEGVGLRIPIRTIVRARAFVVVARVGADSVDVGALALGGNPMQDARSQGDRRGGF